MNIYAIESISYMTAGVLDSFVNPDVFCESAAVKVCIFHIPDVILILNSLNLTSLQVFGSECVWVSLKDALQIMGSVGCKMESGIPNALMNAATNSLTVVSDVTRLKIVLHLNYLIRLSLFWMLWQMAFFYNVNLFILFFQSSNEILKLYIALNCLKHAGLKSQQSIRLNITVIRVNLSLSHIY